MAGSLFVTRVRLTGGMQARARRLVSVMMGVAVWSVFTASPAAAHGIGGRSDLPLDLAFFLVGGGVVVVASFIALAVLWPEPRLQGGVDYTPSSGGRFGGWARLARGLGLGFLIVVVVTGLFGRDNPARSIVPVMIWVGFWLVIPFGSAIFGNMWADLNPWRTLAGWLGFDREEHPEVLASVGVYPAAVAFLAFTWLELVFPDSGSPRSLAIAAVAYTFYALGMASWAGTTTGLQTGEFFTTYTRVLSAIAPFGRNDRGRIVRRPWLRALPVLPEWRGMGLFVIVMIGTVSYDGLSATPWWNDRLADLGLSRGSTLVGTLGLVLVVAVIGAAYWLASWAAGRMSGGEFTAGAVASSFAHSLVPIALAYAVAHYFTLVTFEGQLVWIQASDPFGFGWNTFGTANWRVVNWLGTTAIWYFQVTAIVGGHVLGVILAHDRALALFDKRNAVRSQYAMLVLMVLLTGLGLAILAAG